MYQSKGRSNNGNGCKDGVSKVRGRNLSSLHEDLVLKTETTRYLYEREVYGRTELRHEVSPEINV